MESLGVETKTSLHAQNASPSLSLSLSLLCTLLQILESIYPLLQVRFHKNRRPNEALRHLIKIDHHSPHPQNKNLQKMKEKARTGEKEESIRVLQERKGTDCKRR